MHDACSSFNVFEGGPAEGETLPRGLVHKMANLVVNISSSNASLSVHREPPEYRPLCSYLEESGGVGF